MPSPSELVGTARVGWLGLWGLAEAATQAAHLSPLEAADDQSIFRPRSEKAAGSGICRAEHPGAFPADSPWRQQCAFLGSGWVQGAHLLPCQAHNRFPHFIKS